VVGAGAKSRWANIFTGLFAILAVLLLGKQIERLPMTALAAMLIYAGVTSFNRARIRAVMRIIDRTLSASLRGWVLQGIAVIVATYLGLELLEQFGLLAIKYKLLAAVLAGLAEMIPDIGPFLWAIPAGAIGFSVSREMGLALLGAYLLGRWLVHWLLVSRVEGAWWVTSTRPAPSWPSWP
jgi:hypothetical protein